MTTLLNEHNRLILIVDNSYEISNISLTSRDLIDTHHRMTLFLKS